MDESINMERLARKLHVSRTTVHKALHYCPGIHADTRQAILNAADQYHLTAHRPTGTMAVILPAIPSYFWDDIRRRIGVFTKEIGLPFSCYVYSRLTDAADALRCIRQAVGENTTVLLLAVPDTAEIREELTALAAHRLILLVEEYLAIPNAFYVGEDSYAEGHRLGEEYLSAHPDARTFAVLHTTGFTTEEKRIAGFTDAIHAHQGKLLAHVYPTPGSTTRAAEIARTLAAAPELPAAVFCPSGNVAEARLAVQKLKNDQGIHCIGFDANTARCADGHADTLTHILFQNRDAMARKSVECAARFLRDLTYPDQKHICVPALHYGEADL